MNIYIILKRIYKINSIRQSISFVLISAFIGSSLYLPQAQAGEMVMPWMPKPGVMVSLSPEYIPAHLQGITIHPDNALQFDFLIHKGEGNLTSVQKKIEYNKLVKYFLASLTIPDEEQWVNLSPYEKAHIIPNSFGLTEMGRDLLTQDYLLKQITSSLMYPETSLGKKFWDRVYKRAWNEYHSTDVPVNTFNKVWITPDEAFVYESGNTAYILKSHLKVMLEEDYLSLAKHSAIRNVILKQSNLTHTFTSQIIKTIILPELEKEVNEGKHFAMLRQIYSGMILAAWYKHALKESLLGKVYADKAKIGGIVIPTKVGIQKLDVKVVYQHYLRAFKKGVFNYIKEDVDTYTQQVIPRKYFAGGFDPAMLTRVKMWNPGNTDAVEIINSSNADQVPGIHQMTDQIQGDLGNTVVDDVGVQFDTVDRAMVTKRKLFVDEGISELDRLIKRLSGYPNINRNISRRLHVYESVSLNPAEQNMFTVTGIDLGDNFENRSKIESMITNGELEVYEVKDRNLRDIQFVRAPEKPREQEGVSQKKPKEQERAPQGVWFGNIDLEEFFKKNEIYVSPDNIKVSPTGKSVDILRARLDFPRQGLEEMSNLTELAEKYLRNKASELHWQISNFKSTDMVFKVLHVSIEVKFTIATPENSPDKERARRDRAMATATKLPLREAIFELNNLKVRLMNPHVDKKILNAYSLDDLNRRNRDPNARVKPKQIALGKNFERLKEVKLRIIRGELAVYEFEDGKIWFVEVSKGPTEQEEARDHAMATERANSLTKGGIDLNAANLNLQIKRDGHGVPLPLAQQDMAQLARIRGFVPDIIEIKPLTNLPFLSELQQKLQQSSA